VVDKPRSLSRQKLLNLVSSLEILVNKLKVPPQKSTWSAYYTEASLRSDYLDQKKGIIENWLEQMKDIVSAVDLGANEGAFSSLLARKNINTIACDLDPFCIDRLYQTLKSEQVNNIQPLVIDLSNPSPPTGVNNKERTSFIDRAKADLTLALALVHHLCIGKNIPFEMVAQMMSSMANHLIIEFVPKTDEKVQLMLAQKKDIYTNYSEENFAAAFEIHFRILDQKIIPGTSRVLYLMQRK
jgi:ribosomal protein L11 methylase PrmA